MHACLYSFPHLTFKPKPIPEFFPEMLTVHILGMTHTTHYLLFIWEDPYVEKLEFLNIETLEDSYYIHK